MAEDHAARHEFERDAALGDDELRAAYATLQAPALSHPDDAVWERLACAELPADQRRDLADHVTRCASCAALWRGVQTLRADAAKEAPRARVLPFKRRLGWAGGLAAAAAVVLALVLPRATPGPGTTTTPGDELRSDRVADRPVALAPRGQLAAAPVVLRWKPLAGARAYRVQVLAADGTPLWSSPETRTSELAWPTSVASRPGLYYWQVVALVGAPGGTADEIASALADFEIAAR